MDRQEMKFRGAVTLRSSVLLALLGVGLLPVLLILAASQALLRDTFENSGKRMLESATTLIARRVTETLAHAQAEMRGLAQISAMRCESSPVSEVAREMQVFCSMFPLFEDVSLYDEKGGLLATTTARFWESVRYTEWFERALRGEFVITPPIRLPGRQGLYICSYQYISPSAVGSGVVLTVRYSFEQLQRLVQDASIGRSGWVTLLDPRGNALAYPDAAQILKRPFGTRSATWWMNHPAGILHNAHGERILYHAATVSALHTGSGEPWIVVGFLPYSEILAPLHKSRTVLGITTIITLLTILGAGMVLSRILMAPLTSATRVAETVSKGDLSVVMPEEGPAEVRMLASTFNRMVEDLRQYREHVEAMVEQRTAKLRESQARLEERAAHLRAALESLVDGVLMVQWPEGRVLASNHPFAELFGLKDREPLVGRTLQEVEQWIGSRMADSREDRFQWEHFKREPEAITLEEWEVSAPTRKVLSVSSTPAIGSGGTVLARLYLFRDLTEQRQLEEELRQAQKMEAVGRLAGGIAHDFNNLLTAILGNLSMAEMEPEGARTRSELVAAARQAAQRAADLVKQLLGFSRRSKLQLELCDVNKVIHDVWELVRHSMDPRITFDVRTEPQLWRVRADRTQIQQVIMNLCVNAMDAMPAGGRLTVVTSNVRVTAEQSRQWLDARPGEYVRIAVSDEGHGMSQEVQSHLFQLFLPRRSRGRGRGWVWPFRMALYVNMGDGWAITPS